MAGKLNIRFKIIFLIVLVIALTVNGCDNREDVVKEPEIVYIDPTPNQTYTVYDTIWVKAEIEHIYSLKNISLSVTNADLKPVISSKNITITGTHVLLDTFLIIDNKYIENDQHYLHLEIDDSNNHFNSWFPLNITPLSKQLENLIIVCGVEKQNDLYMLHDNNVKEKITSWDSEYLGGYVDSRFMMFYTLGSLTFGLKGYNIINHSLVWSVAAQPTGSLPYFTSFSAIDGKVSAGLWNGSVDSYSQSGLKIFTSPSIPDGRFSVLLNSKQYIAGIFKPFNGTINKLIIYNYPAGNLYHSIDIEGEPVEMIMADDKTILLLINVNGILKAFQYKTEDKELYFIQNVTNLPVSDATGDGHNIFLISGDVILWYKPETNTTVEYLSVSGINSIVFEPEEKALYVSNDDELRKYLLPSNVPAEIIISEEQVKDILLLYNK